MTIDEIVLLLKANIPNSLSELQELVLRSSWEGKTYTSIAAEAHYGEERVRKVAAHLWQVLSDFWKEPISKSNFRQILEPRRLSRTQQQVLREFNRKDEVTPLEFPSGPVSLNSKFYVPRSSIEELAYAEIAEPGSVTCIKAPKKMGKSSLILRILAHAASLGYSTVHLDFQQADRAVFTNLDKFLRWFCANVSRELALEPRLNDYWDEDMGSKVCCSLYFQYYLLPSLNSPLVLVFNGVDWVFEYPEIAEDFLPLLRSWYEQAKLVEVWQKLRLVLAYSMEFLLPLNLTHSPFNIGLTIKLREFTKEQVQDLAHRHGLDWSHGSDADKLMAMVGGHPYLVRLALYHLVSKGGTERHLGQLLQQAPTEAGIYNDYLRQCLLVLREKPQLGDAFREVVFATSPLQLEPTVAYKLYAMGLVSIEGDRCTPLCELYRLYFREQLNTNSDRAPRLQELEKENQQLRVLSGLDELTQLVSRRSFNTYLQIEWQKAMSKRAPLSLILCDIDYFKFYNKTYGITAGDDCLRQISGVINKCVKLSFPSEDLNSDRNSALVARYGGEQFAILIQTDAANALHVAEVIREEVKALGIPCDYPNIGGLPAEVLTVSLGVASLIPEAQTDPHTLLVTAERALIQAKRRGRDRVVFN
ncbi:diguanylate cyclase [Scytonema hofmannii PCC 7110]|uniref:Diguanylate cyclase n=1 Tax=Scytonema hofmannii PCC 7110 TaxID=128403 RepID=A0A139XFU9_9CYAN|nr:AAA-like domain-containing protein [Scytonema hofmannii]KYC43549.1 diguanylate cyclase [Scytonema hofmannii PCC 7110]